MVARAALVLILVAGLLSGCAGQRSGKDSSSEFTGEDRLVANTIEDLQSAASKGNGDEVKICRDLLAKSLVDKIASHGQTCQAALDTALKDTDSFELQVKKDGIKRNGNTATAVVTADRGDKDKDVEITLVKQGPAWRISDLGD